MKSKIIKIPLQVKKKKKWSQVGIFKYFCFSCAVELHVYPQMHDIEFIVSWVFESFSFGFFFLLD
jgi:hypothetical protein